MLVMGTGDTEVNADVSNIIAESDTGGTNINSGQTFGTATGGNTTLTADAGVNGPSSGRGGGGRF